MGGVFSFSLNKDIMFLQGRTGSQWGFTTYLKTMKFDSHQALSIYWTITKWQQKNDDILFKTAASALVRHYILADKC